MSSNEGKSNTDTNYGPEGRGRTNADKKFNIMKKQRSQFIGSLFNFCEAVKKKPQTMNHPDLTFFCDFVRHIIQHPSQYNTVHGVNPIIP